VRFLRRNGWLIAIVAAYLYVFPYFPAIQSANELPRVYLVKAIVDEHTFKIDTGVRQWHETFDVSTVDGHKYSNKAPGSSFLAAPVYAAVELVAGEPSLATTMWICRFVTGVVPTVLLLLLMWRWLARFAPDDDVRRLVLVAYALGSMAMTYSILFYSHQLSAVCLASAWIFAIDVAERRRGVRAMAAVGGLAGAAILCDYQAAFAAIPIAVDVVLRLRAWPRRELATALGIAAGAALVPIALLLYYHWACYGSPFRTGYDASTAAHGHTHGFLGITGPTLRALAGTTITADNGLFTLSPWLLLAFPGAVTLWRRDRLTAITCASVIAVMLLFVASLAEGFWRGGWEVGPRYVTVLLPFALPLVAAQLEAWREQPLVVGAAAATIVVGVVVYAVSSATFPYWIDYVKNPLYEISFRMLGDDLVAPSLGSDVADGVVSMLPYAAIVAGVTGWAIQRACGWRGLAVAVVVAATIVTAYQWFPRSGAAGEHAYGYVLTHTGQL
jgi:hypothetical protein